VANPNPPVEHLRPQPWQPGQSGNPKGYSQGRRVTDAVVKLIEERGLESGLAAVWVAKALGDSKALGDRNPDFRFFKELLDRIEGKTPEMIITQQGLPVVLEDLIEKVWGDPASCESSAS